MNYLEVLKADLEKGYSKADLERLIGLPKNNLAGVLNGNKKLSRKSELKIEAWEVSPKPNPLTLHKIEYSVPDKKSFDGEKINYTRLDEAGQWEEPTVNPIQERISKIEETLKLPPKYLNHQKKNQLLIELDTLKFRLNQHTKS